MASVYEASDGGRSVDNLTYWGRDKMADIFQATFQTHVLEWNSMNFD